MSYGGVKNSKDSGVNRQTESRRHSDHNDTQAFYRQDFRVVDWRQIAQLFVMLDMKAYRGDRSSQRGLSGQVIHRAEDRSQLLIGQKIHLRQHRQIRI